MSLRLIKLNKTSHEQSFIDKYQIPQLGWWITIHKNTLRLSRTINRIQIILS